MTGAPDPASMKSTWRAGTPVFPLQRRVTTISR
jgi:hypothetical protein